MFLNLCGWAIPSSIEANNPILRATPLFILITHYTPKSRFVNILVHTSGIESGKCRLDSNNMTPVFNILGPNGEVNSSGMEVFSDWTNSRPGMNNQKEKFTIILKIMKKSFILSSFLTHLSKSFYILMVLFLVFSQNHYNKYQLFQN